MSGDSQKFEQLRRRADQLIDRETRSQSELPRAEVAELLRGLGRSST